MTISTSSSPSQSETLYTKGGMHRINYPGKGHQDLTAALKAAQADSTIRNEIRKFSVVKVEGRSGLYLIPNAYEIFLDGQTWPPVKPSEYQVVAEYWFSRSKQGELVEAQAGQLNENGIPYFAEEWPDFDKLQPGQSVMYYHPETREPVLWEVIKEADGLGGSVWLRCTVETGDSYKRHESRFIQAYELKAAYETFSQPLRLYKCKTTAIVSYTEIVEATLWATDESQAQEFMHNQIENEGYSIYDDGVQSTEDITPDAEE